MELYKVWEHVEESLEMLESKESHITLESWKICSRNYYQLFSIFSVYRAQYHLEYFMNK